MKIRSSSFSVLFKEQIINVDEFRRYIEALPPLVYTQMHYYGKWAASILQCLLRSGVLHEEEVETVLVGPKQTGPARFKVGDRVRVRRFEPLGMNLIRKPHLRTPGK